MSQTIEAPYTEPTLIDLGSIEVGTLGGLIGDPEPMNIGLEEKASI